MRWQSIAFGYVTYLAITSCLRRDFAAARRPLLIRCVLVAAIVFLDLRYAPLGAVGAVIVPALVLLFGYQLSGRLFVRVDAAAEAWLRQIDGLILERTGILSWYRHAPRVVTEYFELSYLLVYVAIPLGAVLLTAAGHLAALNWYWSVVLLAEFACYGVLPWVQTRPPMLLEAPAVAARRTGPIRRINQFIASRASIHANTIPSGHVAGAFAAALAISSVLPVAGAVLLFLAASIACASVLGRYHYASDAALGLLVALGAWLIMQ
jgi:membrane-associated phospholipid phosphatase